MSEYCCSRAYRRERRRRDTERRETISKPVENADVGIGTGLVRFRSGPQGRVPHGPKEGKEKKSALAGAMNR